MDDLILEQAVERLLGHTRPPEGREMLSPLAALGRVSAEDVRAAIDQPPFDRSPLDGYAVRHGDIGNADRENPVRLRVTGCTWAGELPAGPILPGEAVQIATGAPMPPGATCVVRKEDTEREGDIVGIFRRQSQGGNICLRGEDAGKGRLLLARGRRIDAAMTGILAGQGIREAAVYPRPAVGILSTGGELADSGEMLYMENGKPTGRIYDSNACMLAARALELGCVPVQGGRVPDDPGGIAAGIGALLSRCDFVVTTGGVSVGERDYLPLATEKVGAVRLFHGVAVKPGRPALAAETGGKLILCLSGNPFAAAATFELLAAPVLRALAGCREPRSQRVMGILQNAFSKESPGRRFVRARMEGREVFLPPGGHESGCLLALSGCNCLVDIPAGSPALAEGAEVEAVLF